MRNVIIGYMFSLLTFATLLAAIYCVYATVCGVIYMLFPAIICLVLSAGLAWMIGEMCDKYDD